MTLPAWHEAAIAKSHDRKAFDCGDRELNDYLHRYARQNHEAGGAKTYVAVDNTDNKTILGFYSLAPGSLSYERAPNDVKKGLARHDVPGYILARLATRKDLQGAGLGSQLLLAAGRRCIRVAAEAGGVILIIEAKNQRAADWYASLDAIPLEDNKKLLVLPLATIREALASHGKL